MACHVVYFSPWIHHGLSDMVQLYIFWRNVSTLAFQMRANCNLVV